MNKLLQLRLQRTRRARLLFGWAALLAVAVAYGLGWRELLLSLGIWLIFECAR